MKTFKTIIAVIGALFAFYATYAQSDKSERHIGIKTQVIKVNGVCMMCKKRIEKAALSVTGVKYASWDEELKTLNLGYEIFQKDAVDNVEKKIALVGHDNDKYKADDKVYAILPDCCKYKTK